MFLVRTVNVVVATIILLNLIILKLNYVVVQSVGSPLLLAILPVIIQLIVSVVGNGSAERNLLSQAEIKHGALIVSPLIVQ